MNNTEVWNAQVFLGTTLRRGTQSYAWWQIRSDPRTAWWSGTTTPITAPLDGGEAMVPFRHSLSAYHFSDCILGIHPLTT